MCGRYVLAAASQDVASALDAHPSCASAPSWNVAPTQSVPILVLDDRGERRLVAADWGIEAPWTERGVVINARSESVGDKRTFATLLAGGRCGVPMHGYYEWRRSDADGRASKVPFHIRPRERGALDHRGTAVALGLVDRTRNQMVVLTRTPGPGVAAIHDRMPYLADQNLLSGWLAESVGAHDLRGDPPPDGDLKWWEVGRGVNSSRSNGPHLLDPVDGVGLFG